MRIVIIGGGIGGLATANLLAKDGHAVELVEKNNYLGGRAGKLVKDGFTFDTGPSWYLMPDVFERYFHHFGTTAQKELDLIKLAPAYKVYGEGGNITVTGDLKKDAISFESREPGAGNVLQNYIAKSRDIYKLSLDHFLYSNFDTPAPFLNAKVLAKSPSMVKLMLTPLHSYVQSHFKSGLLQQVMEYPSVFLGSSPYTAPALYSLMSSLDFDEGVYYPKGTMYAVVESLVRIGTSLGVTYRTGSGVAQILTENEDARGVLLEDGSRIEADCIISGADLHHTETTLLPPQLQTYPESYWKRIEPSPSALLMFLGVQGPIPEFEHHTLVFTDDWKKNFDDIFVNKSIPTPASLYISKTSASDTTAPKGYENIFILVPLPAGITLSDEEQETLSNQYLEQIKNTTGVDLATRIVSKTLFGPDDFANKYNSWQSSMLGPSHLLKQSAFFRTPNKSRKVKGLFYVGASTVPGVGVPMCLISAELVRERVQNFAKKERGH